jgi:hypothetical protein
VTYGLLVVQRRGSGKLWICLAGVTGLGTLAAARTLSELVVPFSPDPGARPSPVFCQLVQAQVRVRPNNPPGRTYELKDWELLGPEPYRWPE